MSTPARCGKEKGTFGLNVADHLAAADESYGYDSLGNRAGVTLVSNVRNRVQQDATFTYSYDNEGNLTTKTRISGALAADYLTTYAWDYRNRLKTVTVTSNDQNPVSTTTTYFYDAFDHRIDQKVVAGGTTTHTQFVYQGDQLLLARAADGVVTDRFLTGPGGQVLAQDTSSSPHWLFADHLGSVRTVIVADGGILGRISYDSFGNVAAGTLTPAAAGSLFGYAGGVYDATTGLNYFQARYYDPASGRFLSEDPIDADPNPYRYVGNNPINLVDPSGLSSQPSYLGGGNSYLGSYGTNFDLSGGQFAYNLAPPQYATPPSYGQSASISGLDYSGSNPNDFMDPFSVNLGGTPRQSQLPLATTSSLLSSLANPSYSALKAAAQMDYDIRNLPADYDPLRNPDAKFISFDAHNYRQSQIKEYGASPGDAFIAELLASVSRFTTDEPRYADLESPGQRTANNVAEFSGNSALLAIDAAAMGAMPRAGIRSTASRPAASTAALESRSILVGAESRPIVSHFDTGLPFENFRDPSIGRYSHLSDPPRIAAGQPFTNSQRQGILEANRQANSGQLISDLSGTLLVPGQRNMKGVTPPANQAQIDHIIPRSRGGTNSYSNAQVLSREENLRKRNH